MSYAQPKDDRWMNKKYIVVSSSLSKELRSCHSVLTIKSQRLKYQQLFMDL